ncbi:MAG: polysaccharide deacetylase family protein [Luteolibacter sp.]|uniref:polysaccharide deacetylase family protein n=1 Tax=Luteolibacter sp. TaxID=1962973 RepID=UPI003265F379
MNPGVVKRLTTSVLRKAGSLTRQYRMGRKVILCFHSVKPMANHSHLHPDAFGGILRWLTIHTDVMSVESLLDADRTDNPRPAVALTFDDGHKDNLTHALPIARDHGVTFSVYVTVGLLERDPRAQVRFTSLLRQKTKDFEALSWDDAGSLIEHGCEIGSHTWDHPMLSHLSDDGIEFQLGESREILLRRLGLEHVGMCYPYGKFGRNVDARVVRATERLGYRYGLCVEHRGVAPNDDRFALPRFIVNSGSLEVLERQISGSEDYHGAISRHMPGFLARKLSPTDFLEPPDAPAPLSALSSAP